MAHASDGNRSPGARWKKRRRACRGKYGTRLVRPSIEQLEDRRLLSVPAEDFGFGGAPATGQRPLMAILAKYSDPGIDFSPQQTPQYYHDFLFGSGTYSVRDYFRENSGGQFEFVPAGPGVVGPIVFPDDPETPSLNESLFATTRTIAGGVVDGVPQMLFANLRVDATTKWMSAVGYPEADVKTISDGASGPLDASQEAELFKVIDIDGGKLQYGDAVRFRTSDGYYLINLVGILTATLDTSLPDTVRPFDQFILEHEADPANTGDIVVGGDAIRVRLKSVSSGRYVQLEDDNDFGFSSRASATVFQLYANQIPVGTFDRTLVKEAAKLVDFRAFDVDRNGVISPTELVYIQFMADSVDPRFNGQQRGLGRDFTVDFAGNQILVSGNSATAEVDRSISRSIDAHELAHTLGALDLYGSGDLSSAMTLMGNSLWNEDDLRTAEFEGRIFHLDPWHKMRFGWMRPDVVDVAPGAGPPATFNLDVRPLIVFDSSRGKQEYYIFEKRPIVGEYDSGVTGAAVPIPGVAVWYVKATLDAAGNIAVGKVTSLNDASEQDVAIFSAGHLGAHVADPNAYTSRGTRENNDNNRLWRDGKYRLHWLDGQDAGAEFTIDRPHGARPSWQLRVSRDGDSYPGSRVTQDNSLLYRLDYDNDQFGAALAMGDFNRDGLMELVVGAPGEGDAALTGVGAVYVRRKTANGWQSIAYLTQTGLDSREAGDRFGAAVAVGDFNGDGIEDIAVGSPGESPGLDPASGAVFLFQGAADGATFQPVQMLTQAGLDANGNEAGDGFGSTLAFGDFNNDGRAELIVGAPTENTNVGAVFVYTWDALATAMVPRAMLTPYDGFHSYWNAGYGTSLAVGYFDGDDAYVDLAVGVPGNRVGISAVGGVYVYQGDEFLRLGKIAMLADPSPQSDDRFGSSLAAGDFNGDERTDLAVGVPGKAFGNTPNVGIARVFYGTENGLTFPTLPSNALNPTADPQFGDGWVTIKGFDDFDTGDAFGAALAAGDFTGDGVDDLAVGSPGESPFLDPNSGTVFLYRAGAGRLEAERYLTQSALDASDASPNEGGDQFGASLVIGDFNDGLGDVVVGAPSDRLDGLPPWLSAKREGAAYFFGGVADPRLLDQVDGTRGDDLWYVRRSAENIRFMELWAGEVPIAGELLAANAGDLVVRGMNTQFQRDLDESRRILIHDANSGWNAYEIRNIVSDTELVIRGGLLAPIEGSSVPHRHEGKYSVYSDVLWGQTITIDGGSGNDRLIVDLSGGRPFPGMINFLAGDDPRDAHDALDLRGPVDSGSRFDIASRVASWNQQTIVATTGVEQTYVRGGTGTDTIDITFVEPGRDLRLHSRQIDTVRIGGGDYVANVRAPVAVYGDGASEIVLADSNGVQVGSDGTVDYHVGFSTVRRIAAQPTPELAFFDSRKLTIEGTQVVDRFRVDGVYAAMTVELQGGGGNDIFDLSDSTVANYRYNFPGQVVVDGGGGGNDRVVIHDTENTALVSGTTRYDFGSLRESNVDYGTFAVSGRFEKSPPPALPIAVTSGLLRYRDVERVELEGASVESTISVAATLDGANLILNGNSGDDQFELAGDRLRSNVTLHGGGPTQSPGDSLLVTGGSTASGNFDGLGSLLVNGREIRFDGIDSAARIEAFTAFSYAAPFSFDLLRVESAPEGRARVGGTSGGVRISTRAIEVFPLVSVEFKNVGEFTVNAGQHDLEPFQFNGQWYAPLPDDQVTLEADALGGAPCQTFVVLAGAGTNRVTEVLPGHGQASRPLLRVNGQGGFTHHVLEGDWTWATVDATSQSTHAFRAYDVDGGMLARAEFVWADSDMRYALTRALEGTATDAAGVFHLFPVTRTSDFGDGTLREAIRLANASPAFGTAVIYFNLPESLSTFIDIDSRLPGGDPEEDVWMFRPLSPLPALTRGQIILNGDSQSTATSDPNAFGPEIVIDGSNTTDFGLVSRYLFEGNALDVAGSNDPSLVKGVDFVAGRVGQGVHMRTNGYIDIPQASGLAEPNFTIAAWVRPDGAGPLNDAVGNMILSKALSQQELSVGLSWSAAASRFVLTFGDPALASRRIESAHSFAPGQFHHVAATVRPTASGRQFALYVNGNLEGTRDVAGPMVYNHDTRWTIGNNSDRIPWRTWNGVIDELSFYSRSLQPVEIARMADPIQGHGLELASHANRVQGVGIQQFSGAGIRVGGDDNVIVGNTIGLAPTGLWARPNGVGVGITGAGNLVRLNAIGANEGLGIDLGNDGVSPNDRYDADSGPNQLQNFPVLMWAEGGDETRVVGWLDSRPNYRFVIDLFANGSLDSSGHGEGQRHLGAITVTTDSRGTAVFDRRFSVATEPDEWITATATNIASGNTSEFSAARLANDAGFLFLVTNTRDGGPGSLRQAILDANGADVDGRFDARIVFLLPERDPGYLDVDASLGGDADPDAFVIQPQSPLPPITRDWVTLDGLSQQAFIPGDTNPRGPEIVLDGHLAGDAANGLELRAMAGVIRGFNIQRFSGDGIVVEGINHQVAGNYIGTNATGTGISIESTPSALTGNHLAGVRVVNGISNRIGGLTAEERNVVSGNLHGVHVTGDFIAPPPPSGDVVIIQPPAPNQILGNFIGTTADGLTACGNALTGVWIDDSPGNIVGGTEHAARNVVSGQETGIGVWITGYNHAANRVVGNYIGIDAMGERALPNLDGVYVSNAAAGNLVGGSTAADRNVISGNHRFGIGVSNTLGTRVIGNYIGTDPSGTRAVTNLSAGIGWLNDVGTVIGGTGQGAGNVISGNNIGIWAYGGSAVADGQIEGNRIGTTADGLGPLPNAAGIKVHDVAIHLVIGGINPSAGNLISGNGIGVQLIGSGMNGVQLQGNQIGTNLYGASTVVGNVTGISIENAAGVLVGGADDGAGNLISGNVDDGVRITGVDATGNVVQGNVISANGHSGVAIIAGQRNQIRLNAIYANVGIGVDLAGDGPTANDLDTDGRPIRHDIDVGPNLRQNYPRLTIARTGTDPRITGRLQSSPLTSFVIDVYASPAAAATGFRQGARWIASTTITTNEDGERNFDVGVGNASIAAGELITATATDPDGNTSEFSEAIVVRENGGGKGNGGGNGGEKPLLAAALPEEPVSSSITLEQIGPIVEVAFARWQVDERSHGWLGDLDVRITDLPAGYLGMASDRTIWLDGDAAGWGWFIDPTPGDSNEFIIAGDQGERNHIDLLSAVLHELGHTFGLDHGENEGDVMFESLSVGQRASVNEHDMALLSWLAGFEQLGQRPKRRFTDV